jgi:hypothetical protein
MMRASRAPFLYSIDFSRIVGRNLYVVRVRMRFREWGSSYSNHYADRVTRARDPVPPPRAPEWA